MSKLGLVYYAEMGIIDFFGFALTKEELKARINNNLEDIDSTGYNKITNEDIDTVEKEIIHLISEKTGEKPHTIRFFGIPNFTNMVFDLGCVAKINNNGSTFLFAKDKHLFQYLDEANGYQPIINKIF